MEYIRPITPNGDENRNDRDVTRPSDGGYPQGGAADRDVTRPSRESGPKGPDMEVKTCPRGHYYVGDHCAECAREEEAGSRISPTLPVDKDGVTRPGDRGFADRRMGGGYAPRPLQGLEEQVTRPMPDDGATQVIGIFGTPEQEPEQDPKGFFNPLVGWLVCVAGPDKGADYRIYSGYNYIGRGLSMSICIAGDPYISHDRHAMIAFDARECKFFFAPVSGQSLVRVNDMTVMNPVEVKSHDILEIGQTKLMLIPLCDDSFIWK